MNLKRKYYFLLFINLITGCNTFNSSYLDSSFESDESLERTNSNYTKDYMYTSENSGYENVRLKAPISLTVIFQKLMRSFALLRWILQTTRLTHRSQLVYIRTATNLLHELEFSDR